MARASLRIDGLRCAGCAAALAGTLRATPGVRNVEVTQEAATARIEYDEAKTAPATLAEIVREEGFGATLVG